MSDAIESFDCWAIVGTRDDGTEFVTADMPGPGRIQLPSGGTIYVTRAVARYAVIDMKRQQRFRLRLVRAALSLKIGLDAQVSDLTGD